MKQYKIYTKGNYIVIVDVQRNEYFYGIRKEVHIDKSNVNKAIYRAFNVKDFSSSIILAVPNILKENGDAYSESEFDTFYQENTGNFNGGGTAPAVLSVTGDSVDNTDPQNPIINAIPVSATQSGIVDNTSLQELGGKDKLINGVRIGQGNAINKGSTALGVNALSVDTGGYNTAVGFEALKNVKASSGNTAIGGGALRNLTNTAVGDNTAVGVSSLASSTTGYANTSVGKSAGTNITTGRGNTVIGNSAGLGITTGNANVIVSSQSGGSGITTGSNNILIQAGNHGSASGITTGSNNIIIKQGSYSLPAGTSNTLIIGDRIIVDSTGLMKLGITAPVYGDNASAIAGGLTAGNIYRKATGELMIVF